MPSGKVHDYLRMVALLKDGPLTAAQVAQRLWMPVSNVCAQLARAHKLGLCARTVKGADARVPFLYSAAG